MNCESSDEPELEVEGPTDESPFTIFFRSSEPGILYYVVSQEELSIEISVDEIMAQTMDKHLVQTEIG